MPISKIICCGTEVSYFQQGSGEPLIFLHNGGGFHQCWSAQLAHFSKNHTVYALDWPGFGDSDPVDRDYTIDFYYEVLRDFLSQKQVHQPVIIGNCIGASIAMFYCLKHPGSVRGLVLLNICPGIRIMRPLMRPIFRLCRAVAPLRRLFSAVILFLMTRSPLKKKFPRILYGNAPDPTSDLFQKYVARLSDPTHSQSRLRLLFGCDSYTTDYFLEDPSQLVRRWMVWGEANRVVSLKEGRRLEKLIEPERFETIEEAGHLAMVDDHKRCTAIIESFLRTGP